MKKHLKESILWVIIILPYIYLITIWQQLPDRVPTHFNLLGQADYWSGKNFLLFLPTGLGALIYLIMRLTLLIDPKKKLQQMGDKLNTLRFVLTVFCSMLSFYLLYVTKEGGIENTSMFIAIIGFLFVLLGNYFQAIRPNYFIGIRTPWTLENEQVWKKTHQLSGRLFMIGGVLMVIVAFAVSNAAALKIILTVILSVIILVPLIFSYIEYKKEKSLLN